MKKLVVEEWDGKDLPGMWEYSLKRDGILCIRQDDGTYTTKNGKPMYNLPDDVMDSGFEMAEIFCGSWGETWSIVSASKSPRRKVELSEIFPILPEYGEDTFMIKTVAPASMIRNALKVALIKGYEGIVLRQQDRFVKVKPEETVDVVVTGLVPSNAKSHKGALKEFVTEKGKVGIGLTREQRFEYMNPDLIGTTIEVKVIGGYTKNGKFRHARFIRLRPDK